MTVQDLIHEARSLTVEERKQLVMALIDMLAESSGAPDEKPRQSLLDFRGLGAHLSDETDPQAYISRLRAEWDEAS